MKIYVSLTTIPTRHEVLKKCLNSLLKQTCLIEKIILTIPKRTLRSGEKTTIPKYLYQYPYKDKVIIERPKKDYGPIMKYIGPYKYITKKDLVIVCDDDQEYNYTLFDTLFDKYLTLENDEKPNTVITASGDTIVCTDVVYGHGSLLVPGNVIQLIRRKVVNSSEYVRKSCQLVDDNWVSIILKKEKIKVINLNLGDKRYLNGHPTNPSDGLSQTTNRIGEILTCTYAIDHENTFPIVALILVLIFLIIIIVNYYYISYL